MELDIIEELNKCEGYQVALLSTYSCDINFINKIIVSRLLDKNCNKIILFVDRGMLTENLKRDKNVRLGSDYIINPIKSDYAFHPKVFLLLGKEKAKVIIGSGNLTCAGMLSNNEVFAEFEYSKDRIEHLEIIKRAYNMFLNIAKMNPYPLQNEVLDSIHDYDYLKDLSVQNDSLCFIDNYIESISGQVFKNINESIRSIDIIVPYFDSKCIAVKKLIEHLKVNECRVFVQNGKSKLKPSNLPTDSMAYSFENFNCNNKFYHAKVFVFYGEKSDYILYGSTNCSNQALFSNYEIGNYEACILEKGNKGDFNYFFDWIKDSKELILSEYSSIENSEKFTYCNTFFEYAILNEDELVIELHQNKIIPVEEVRINNIIAPFTQFEGRIIITLKSNLDNYIANDLSFKIFVLEKGHNSFELTGWYLNKQSLMLTLENKKEIIKQMILNGQWDTDLSCILGIIGEFQEKSCWNYEDLTKSEEYIKKKLESEKEINNVNDNIEDYIVEENSDMYFINTFNSKSIIHIFYNMSIKRLTEIKLSSNNSMNKENLQIHTKTIEVDFTEYEIKWLNKQLKSLIKYYYLSFEDNNYMSDVPWDSFWEKNMAVLEFAYSLVESNAYKDFQSKNNIQLPLHDSELIKMYVALINSLVLYKKQDNLTEKSKQAIYKMGTYSIVWTYNHSVSLSDEGKIEAKKILDMLRKIISDDIWFRDNYVSISPLLEEFSLSNTIYSKIDMIECFEKLFDYYTIKSATNKLKAILGMPFVILNESKPEIIIQYPNNEEFQPYKGLFKEKIREVIIILRKIESVERSNSLTVTIVASKGNIEKYTICVSHNLYRMKEIINYRNGKMATYSTDRIKWRL